MRKIYQETTFSFDGVKVKFKAFKDVTPCIMQGGSEQASPQKNKETDSRLFGDLLDMSRILERKEQQRQIKRSKVKAVEEQRSRTRPNELYSVGRQSMSPSIGPER